MVSLGSFREFKSIFFTSNLFSAVVFNCFRLIVNYDVNYIKSNVTEKLLNARAPCFDIPYLEI